MSKICHIYTDGSHFKNGGSGRLGIGGILVDPSLNLPKGKELSSFSLEIGKDFLNVHYGTTDVSNPTMEMLAALFALKEFKGDLVGFDKIILMADYEGVKYWLDGTWTARKSYIQKIKEDIKKEISSQGLDIEFKWIRGHQKISDNPGVSEVFWNSEVDKLAKGEKR